MLKRHKLASAGTLHMLSAIAGELLRPEVSESDIAERAYSYWERRGYHGGSAEQDWYTAVEELRAERRRWPAATFTRY
jgi:hypothetical protein